MTTADREPAPDAQEPIILERICRCSHPESDHLGDCAYGWSDEPGEDEPCTCIEFALDYEIVR